MKKLLALVLITVIEVLNVPGQNAPQKPDQSTQPDEILRITTELVQTDVVVTDKNDQIVPDLKLEDFEIYDSGKKQQVKFMEFVSVDTGRRTEGAIARGVPIEAETAGLSAKDLKRVVAFVIDDLTVPYEDVVNVRNLLTDFVNNKMREGDLVAIVRVAGGRGLLQQFTSDRQLLRKAIAEISPTLNAYSAFHNLDPVAGINTSRVLPTIDDASTNAGLSGLDSSRSADVDASAEGITRGMRSLVALSTAADVVNGMKQLPGRKNLVLVSGGLPLIETTQTQIRINGAPTTVTDTRSMYTNVSFLLRQLTDRASRAGVVINTLNIRAQGGVKGVSGFTDPGNEGRSGLLPNAGGDETFGRAANIAEFDNTALDSLSGNLGLRALANATGGISVTDTNNFNDGLDKILARSSYYLLAYRPTEPFNGKFHKIDIKVARSGARIYTRAGYVATADEAKRAETKEQTIIRAAMSPLAHRDIDLKGTLQYRFLADKAAAVDVNLQVSTQGLTFKEAGGKYETTFDIVAFLINEQGKPHGGFSETVNAKLSPEEYKRAEANAIGYTGQVDLPPGGYQLRAIVRDTETGRLGTLSRYLEVPDISKKRLTVSSLFLYAVDPAQGNKATPEQLTALRQLPRTRDLRYAVIVYNPKLRDGKTQLLTRVIISRGDKVLFEEKDQPLAGSVENGQIAKVGQFGLPKAQPGRYLLTLVVTDPQAPEKERIVVRSIDFTLVE